MFDGTEDWCNIWRKADLCFLKIFFYRQKNSNFILESKMVELSWKQNLLIYLRITRMFPILTSRNRLMNAVIIVNITPTCKDKSTLSHSKKSLLVLSVWPGTEYTWALIWKKSLLICFENYQGIPYFFPYRQSRQEFEHFANGEHPICKR